MSGKVPQHVRDAAVEAAWALRERVLIGHDALAEVNPRAYVDAALDAVEDALELWVVASDATAVPVYRFTQAEEQT